MYSKKFNLLFIHIPKTAGQSITKHFLDLEGIAWEDLHRYHVFQHDNPEHGPPQSAHFTLQEYYQNDFLSDEIIDNAIKFAIVRNPFDRLWSEYNYYWAHLCSWDHFFELFPKWMFDDHETGRDALRHIKPQNEFIDDRVEVLRFENLKSDFYSFCVKHNLPNRELPMINISGVDKFINKYDNKKIKAVQDYYAKDIEQFGYEFLA